MDAIYRMLGHEHEAELERLAVRPTAGSGERGSTEAGSRTARCWRWVEVWLPHRRESRDGVDVPAARRS